MKRIEDARRFGDESPWRLALLLVLGRTAFIAALLGDYVLAFAFFVATGLVVLDLVDLRRARIKLERAYVH